MSRLALCVATMREGNSPGDIPLATTNASERLPVYVRHNTPEDNLGVVKSYQYLYENSTEEILCFLHDDVIVRERRWDLRLQQEFNDPSVGLVGMGGGRWHGTTDLYKRPYLLQNLRRGDYLSNVDDAEVHGSRFTDVADVAVLDGFCLTVRRDLLDRLGGFKLLIENNIDFIGYDYMLCCLAHRYGYKIRVVGIRCHHRGGGTSVGINVDRQAEYDYAHRYIYEEFRDVLPWTCK